MLNYQMESYLLAVLAGWNDISVTFLLSVVMDESTIFNSKKMIESDKAEWENDLWWLSVQKLKEYSNENILDGLSYFRSKI